MRRQAGEIVAEDAFGKMRDGAAGKEGSGVVGVKSLMQQVREMVIGERR